MLVEVEINFIEIKLTKKYSKNMMYFVANKCLADIFNFILPLFW